MTKKTDSVEGKAVPTLFFNSLKQITKALIISGVCAGTMALTVSTANARNYNRTISQGIAGYAGTTVCGPLCGAGASTGAGLWMDWNEKHPEVCQGSSGNAGSTPQVCKRR